MEVSTESKLGPGSIYLLVQTKYHQVLERGPWDKVEFKTTVKLLGKEECAQW